MGINVPFSCVGTRDAHRLLDILEIFRVFRKAATLGNSILDHNAIHADRVKPRADLCAFHVVREMLETTSGEDKCSRACVRCRTSQVRNHAGMANVCNAHGRLAGHHAVGVGGRVDLRAHHLRRFGIAVRPKQNGLLLSRKRGSNRKRRGDKG